MSGAGHVELLGDCIPADAHVLSYKARERISAPFEATVEFITASRDFSVDSCLRQGIALRIAEAHDRRQRLLHGVCDQAEFVLYTGEHFHFRLRLRPSMGALSHREDQRIYQDQSAVDVVQQVLTAAGIDAIEWRLQHTYPPREYVVQYRETEQAFVDRLMEHEGIFYFFEHDSGEHKLVFGDGPHAFTDRAPVPLSMSPGDDGVHPLRGVRRTVRLRQTTTRVRDYDFERPQNKPSGEQAAEGAWPMPHYEYPGGFVAGAEGARLATARLRELRRQSNEISGQSLCNLLNVGAPLEILGSMPASLDGVYVLTELTSQGTQPLPGAQGTAETCINEFRAIPPDAPFAPARVTPRPRIRGVQTATVVGPSSDEQAIHCDSYGRVKVRFHWDRVGQYNDKATCWLRVLQPALGGAIIIPRFGWEVAVGYLSGDPDRPYVVGRLYDGQHAPPYGLPATQASGSLKSMSSPGAAGSNELIMADSGGSQGFGIHAEKDFNITIGNDKVEDVAVDEEHNIKCNMSVSIGSNETCSVGANQATDVGAICSANVTGNQSILVGGNFTDNATANYVEKVGANRSYTVGGNMTTISNTVMQTVTGNISKQVGSVMLTASVASIADNVGAIYSETVGAVKVDICKGVSSESVGGAKMLTCTAAEAHLVKGTMNNNCDAATTQLVGGLHYQKIAGDYSVTAPMITLLGAVGDFKAGGTNLKLGGGPVVLKSSKITVEGLMIVKMGGQMKLGPG